MLTLSSSSSSSLSILYFNLSLLFVSLFLAPVLSVSFSQTLSPATFADPSTPDLATPAVTTTTFAVTTTPESREGGGGNEISHVEWREEEGGGNESEHVERRGGGGNKTDSVEGKKGMKVVKHFYLWTRRNSGNSSAQVLDPTRPSSISGSLFREGKTFVIIHGFLGWGTEPWILHFKDKLLRVFPSSNVVSVDWPAGSAWWLPGYYTAVHRVPGVAEDLAALLHSLATTCHLDLHDLHLIGHSLGAHVAGLAAAPLQTVGRISGLDPAGLMYHNVPANQRLDPSDATYVDVIHTNGCNTFDKWLDCYGINENIGHSDFWPNGGKHQPSCTKKRKRVTNGEIGCSHEMAYMYYIESLDYSVDQTYYLARACGSWDDYEAGQCSCGRETQYMGFSVNIRLNGTYYLSTNDSPPYATKDDGCPPGSATGPGVRMITTALISASTLILAIHAIVFVTKVARRRWAAREWQVEAVAGGSSSGGSVGASSGDCDGDVLVETSDKVPIIG
ncbi:hypothetical protein O3P69_014761 [Scylla paramamosain]|uniref:Lipase domain-containing protein n=2 Tax=Scylla paramamosain TaxID=85552 RepID=A0AAW0TZ96_SCYPA